MAKLPTQKKILKEDLRDAPSWVNGIIEPINSFMETVYNAFNRNVTLADNVGAFIKEFTYRTPSTYPAGVETMKIRNELKGKAVGLQLLQIYDKSLYVAPAGPCYIPWVETDAGIELGTITGLAADKVYIVRICVYA